MKLNEMFPSAFLKCADLDGRPALFTIRQVTIESIGEERKAVVHFTETEQGLVLNKINGNTIGEFLGNETDGWRGKQIVLYPDRTQFNGKMVDCIRVRQPKNAAPAAPAPEPQPPEEDDVPF